mmetsp:Transcript_15238/g.36746  ORF Transcript_15238/g.36746 Transcript_15238/m.36746 type:complete len:321 (+) Transcript_15238:2410-3372(+)
MRSSASLAAFSAAISCSILSFSCRSNSSFSACNRWRSAISALILSILPPPFFFSAAAASFSAFFSFSFCFFSFSFRRFNCALVSLLLSMVDRSSFPSSSPSSPSPPSSPASSSASSAASPAGAPPSSAALAAFCFSLSFLSWPLLNFLPSPSPSSPSASSPASPDPEGCSAAAAGPDSGAAALPFFFKRAAAPSLVSNTYGSSFGGSTRSGGLNAGFSSSFASAAEGAGAASAAGAALSLSFFPFFLDPNSSAGASTCNRSSGMSPMSSCLAPPAFFAPFFPMTPYSNENRVATSISSGEAAGKSNPVQTLSRGLTYPRQ